MKAIVTLMVLLLISCSEVSRNYIADPSNRAIYCAKTVKSPNEILISFIPAVLRDRWKAQAKVKINNKWEWLQMDNNGNCYMGYKDNTDLNEFSLNDFIKLLNLWDTLTPEQKSPLIGGFR